MQLSIAIPDSIVLSTRQSNRQFEIEAKRAIAIKFYVDEKLSLGQAAELAGLTKFEFMKLLGDNQVSIFRFDSLAEELKRDAMNAEKVANG